MPWAWELQVADTVIKSLQKRDCNECKNSETTWTFFEKLPSDSSLSVIYNMLSFCYVQYYFI